jgi:hypothetical protein
MSSAPDASTPDPGEESNNMGENSPDEKRKKVKYFQEIEKILGVIEEFIDGVEEKTNSVPTTDTFTIKNLEYIKKALYEYKEKTTEVLTKGITKLSYTDLIRLFFHIQNSIDEIRKLYEFTLSQRKIEKTN